MEHGRSSKKLQLQHIKPLGSGVSVPKITLHEICIFKVFSLHEVRSIALVYPSLELSAVWVRKPMVSFSSHITILSSRVLPVKPQPENIMLLDKEVQHPHIKVIDFGLAHFLTPGQEYRSLCGTPQYIGERHNCLQP